MAEQSNPGGIFAGDDSDCNTSDNQSKYRNGHARVDIDSHNNRAGNGEPSNIDRDYHNHSGIRYKSNSFYYAIYHRHDDPWKQFYCNCTGKHDSDNEYPNSDLHSSYADLYTSSSHPDVEFPNNPTGSQQNKRNDSDNNEDADRNLHTDSRTKFYSNPIADCYLNYASIPDNTANRHANTSTLSSANNAYQSSASNTN